MRGRDCSIETRVTVSTEVMSSSRPRVLPFRAPRQTIVSDRSIPVDCLLRSHVLDVASRSFSVRAQPPTKSFGTVTIEFARSAARQGTKTLPGQRLIRFSPALSGPCPDSIFCVASHIRPRSLYPEPSGRSGRPYRPPSCQSPSQVPASTTNGLRGELSQAWWRIYGARACTVRCAARLEPILAAGSSRRAATTPRGR